MEVLAALGLSAMVIGAALSLLQTTRQHGRHLIEAAQQRLDAYAALSVLAVHGRLAGYGLIRVETRPKELLKPEATAAVKAVSGDAQASQASDVSDVSAQARRKFPRDDGRIAVLGDVGDTWSGARRTSTGPQPVRGSERVRLRYQADKVSVWLTHPDKKPANCEGGGLQHDSKLIDAYMQVLSDASGGERSLYCSESAMRAGGPLVANVGSVQFGYWLPGDVRPRGVNEMMVEDWVNVIGFDVCLTMFSATRKPTSGTSRSLSQPMRESQQNDGVGEARCRGPHQFHRTIALRNNLY